MRTIILEAISKELPTESHSLNCEANILAYRVFSRDVTAAMLVSLNKGKVAMVVSPTNHLGIEL